MLVSLFADASYMLEHRLATWGTYHVRGGSRKDGGGIIQGPVHSSNDAEAMAIIKGLQHALHMQPLAAGDCVIIQTDCLGAMHLLNKGKDEVWAWSRERRATLWERRSDYYDVGLQNIFWMYVYNNDLRIEFRHVKGHVSHRHRGENDPQRKRTWVNQRCDNIAGRYMSEALKHLTTKKTA